MSAELLALSDERDRQAEREVQAERRGYDRGHADGYQAGYRQGVADADAHWMWCLAPARESARRSAAEPDHTEVERHRWAVRGEPRTRETFGQPHPGDYVPN